MNIIIRKFSTFALACILLLNNSTFTYVSVNATTESSSTKTDKTKNSSTTNQSNDATTESKSESDAFEGWDDKTKDYAYNIYKMTDWSIFQKRLTLTSNIDYNSATYLKRTSTAKANVSKKTRKLEGTVKKTLKNCDVSDYLNEDLQYENTEFTELMLAIIDVLSNGEPDKNDPCQVIKYNISGMDTPSNPPILKTTISAEESISICFSYLVKCLDVHNQSVEIDTESSITADTNRTADIYKNDNYLKSVIQGLLLTSDYSRKHAKYTKKNATDFYEANKQRCFIGWGNENKVVDSMPDFAIQVTKKYKVTTYSNSGIMGYPTELCNQIPKFYQDDYPNTPYGSHGTVKTSGCGPTCLAMCLTYATGSIVTPAEIAEKYGEYHVAQGSSWNLFTDACKDYNVPIKQTNNFDEVEKAIEAGKAVISSQSAGLFTSGGHFIVIVGKAKINFYVNDPNKNNAITKNYNLRLFTKEEINNTSRNYWIIN